jgi:hypothetical protein
MPSPKPTVVSDETVQTPAPVPSTDVPSVTPASTKWEAFERANLIPVSVKCDGNRPYHNYNSGCHTHLPPKIATLLNHLDSDHGGGFEFELRVGDGKPWGGWLELKAQGIEIAALTCNWCNADIPVHPQHIMKHLKPHPGRFKRPFNNKTLDITLARNTPTTSADDAYADF